jgi:hypothetical protein
VDINLRSEFRQILENYGHNIYLQRRLPDDYLGEAQYPEARFTNVWEKHTVRDMLPGSTAGLAHVLMEGTAGLSSEVDLIFWFMWDVDPKTGDIVWQPSEYNTGSGQGKYKKYILDEAYPYRGTKGEVVYWGCGATEDKPNKQ